MTNLYSVLEEHKVVAVVGNQWGDEGKGKFVDLFSNWADIIARGTGGSNAGHTIMLGGKKKIFHLIPSGILKDDRGKRNIMGSGMTIDLMVLNEELNNLKKNGCRYDGLRISEKAHLILPYHKELDKRQSSMGAGKLGTTGRGIGPACADKISRIGVVVGDLKDKERFVKKLKGVKEYHFYLNINIEEIVEKQYKYYQEIKDMVCNTDALLRKEIINGKNILLEGAQGLLLSVDYGTYPYVTSSDSSRYGLAKGVGLLPEEVDLTLGVVKFPFMTRVGNGPFPTEYGGEESEHYCAENNGNAHKKFSEMDSFENKGDLINSPDPFIKGVGIRLKANEYGATTARPRRVGRTDLVALKHAMNINGPHIILTKGDCVKGMEEVELGIGYKDRSGREIKKITRGGDITHGLEGVYKEFPGWKEDIKGCERYNDLPGNALMVLNYLLKWGVEIEYVSVGPEAKQTLLKN